MFQTQNFRDNIMQMGEVLTAVNTSYNRYRNRVGKPFVPSQGKTMVISSARSKFLLQSFSY